MNNNSERRVWLLINKYRRMDNMNGCKQTAGRMDWWTNVPCELFIFDSGTCDHSDIVIALSNLRWPGCFVRYMCQNRKTCHHAHKQHKYRHTVRLCVRFKNASFYCRRFQSFQSQFGPLFSLVSIAVWIYFNWLQNTGTLGANILYLKLFICCLFWHPWVALKGPLIECIY